MRSAWIWFASFDVTPPQMFFLEKWPLCKTDLTIDRRAFGEDFVFAIAKNEGRAALCVSPSEKVIGCANCTYQKSIAGSPAVRYFSCFIVHPDFRGIGVGQRLYDIVMANHPEVNCSLNAGLFSQFSDGAGGEMSEKYARNGFDKFFPWTLVRYSADIKDLVVSKLHEFAERTDFIIKVAL